MSTRMRAARALVLLALVGCAGDDQAITFSDDGGVTDPGPDADAPPPKGPFDITIASTPPIDLRGPVLWLDPDYGIAHTDDQADTWTDRAGFGLVLERPPVDQAGPTLGRLGNQRALRFGGDARLVLSNAVDQNGRAALTLGREGFLIALVVAPDDARPATLFTLTPDVAEAGTIQLQLVPLRLTIDQGGQQTKLEAAVSLVPGQPHLVIVGSADGALSLRVDGEIVAMRAFAPVAFPFESPAIGGASRSVDGGAADDFAGLLGDVVLVTGPATADATAPLEEYLRAKYGF